MSDPERRQLEEILARAGITSNPSDATAVRGDGGPVVAAAWRRIVAYLFDWLVLAVVVVPIELFWSTRTHPHPAATVVHATTGASWLVAGLGVAYEVVGIGAFGATLGKRIMQLRVVRTDGSPAGWIRAVVRLAVAVGAPITWLPIDALSPALAWAFSLWPVVVYGAILFTPRRRGLHDLAAGTVVVMTAPQAPPIRPPATPG